MSEAELTVYEGETEYQYEDDHRPGQQAHGVPRDVAEAERVCRIMEEKWESSKRETKACKEAFEEAVDRLRHLVRDHSEPNLFNDGDSA